MNIMKDNCGIHSTRSSSGFSLLEVMIALLVLSVGLLGLAGMQIKSLQANQIAYARSQAVQLAYDMADRMRANRGSAGNYPIAHSAAAPAFTNCVSTDCTPAQMVAYDQAAWKTSIAALLPGGGGEITSPSANNFVITVRWDQERTGATGTNCPPASATDLQCYRMTLTF